MNLDVDAVVAQVKAMCAAITGVRAVAAPTPEPIPSLSLPLATVDVRTPDAEPHSYQSVKVIYTVQISLYLGNADMPRAKAAAAAAPFYGRFIDKFWGDPKLGGTCDHSELENAVTNFRTYAKRKTQPRIMWNLVVEHYGKPS